jgi:hypothetical protein
MTRPCRADRSWALWFAVLCSLPSAAGCGTREGKLTGQVLYQGNPLPGGWLTFQPADPRHNAVTALIGPDGRYEATLPVGDVVICVDNREWQPRPRPSGERKLPPGVQLPEPAQPDEAPPPKAEPPEKAGSYVPLPEKYYEVEKSGLKWTVKPGHEAHDIELQ